MTEPRLLITRSLPQAVLAEAQRRFEVRLRPHDEPIGAEFDAWSRGCDAVPVMATDRLDRPRLQALAHHAQAIAAGRIGAAGLDVYRNEPRIDPRFLSLPHTTLLPHIGSATTEARTAMGLVILQALDRWLREGQPSDNCLNPSTLQRRKSP